MGYIFKPIDKLLKRYSANYFKMTSFSLFPCLVKTSVLHVGNVGWKRVFGVGERDEDHLKYLDDTNLLVFFILMTLLLFLLVGLLLPPCRFGSKGHYRYRRFCEWIKACKRFSELYAIVIQLI